MANIDHRYLRPIKARHREGMLSQPFPMRQDLSLWTGCNATIYPLRELAEDNLLFGRGGVADADGNYVALSGIPERIDMTYPCDPPEFRDKKVVYCGYLVGQWGHFLVEGVARLWYFLEKDPTIDKYVFFIEENQNREIRGNFREFLELLGIWDHLEIINRPTAYREVIVPELGYYCQHYYSEGYRKVFDQVTASAIAGTSGDAYPEKIYFSRSQFRKNGELEEFGHDLLDHLFQKNGYVQIAPEKCSLTETIRQIYYAREVASLSGSAAHNFLFGQQGKQVLILDRLVFNDDNQADIDRIREQNVTYVDVSIPLYTCDFGGPFIVGYSEQTERFVHDQGYLPPDPEFLSERYRRKIFAGYMQAYWNRFRLRWHMLDWYSTCTDQLWEGYQAGEAYFRPYMNGEKPYFWYHCFYPHYIKQFIKGALRKLGLYR